MNETTQKDTPAGGPTGRSDQDEWVAVSWMSDGGDGAASPVTRSQPQPAVPPRHAQQPDRTGPQQVQRPAAPAHAAPTPPQHAPQLPTPQLPTPQPPAQHTGPPYTGPQHLPAQHAPAQHAPAHPGPAAAHPAAAHAQQGPVQQSRPAGTPPAHPGMPPQPGHGGPGSDAALDERSMVRERADRPSRGWRLAVMKMTGGAVNPGPSPAERAHQQLLNRIRRPLRGSHRIAVMSVKGGVGKTTVAACLGLAMAEHRGDRVLVMDANPDAGTLADRLTAENAVTVRDLINNIESARSLTDVARYTSLAGRLQVLASEQDPDVSEYFNRDEYERVSAVITRFYNIAITDSGTGLVHSAMEGTLALADTLVIVGAPTVDGASRASKTVEWLQSRGHGELVRRAVVVLSGDRSSKEVDAARIRDFFLSRCRAVVDVPYDPHLATGGRIDARLLKPVTMEAFLELAAHVADGFGRDPLRPEQD